MKKLDGFSRKAADMRSQAALAILLCFAGTVDCRAADISNAPRASEVASGIPNFHEVSPGVYRGGQPTSAGWAFLKSKGVRTVVKLNLASEGSDEGATKLGMTVIDASGPPSSVKDVFGSPKPERIRLAVEVDHRAGQDGRAPTKRCESTVFTAHCAASRKYGSALTARTFQRRSKAAGAGNRALTNKGRNRGRPPARLLGRGGDADAGTGDALSSVSDIHGRGHSRPSAGRHVDANGDPRPRFASLFRG